jgi:lysophospholipase L1-like esterase
MFHLQRNPVLYLTCAVLCVLLAGCIAPSGKPGTKKSLNLPWDWTGIIGTGQSLAVGEQGLPVKSTNRTLGNLKLFTGKLAWPVDPADASLALVPLTEPIGRRSTNYPSAWPDNIAGETPHAAMANELSTLVRAMAGRDFVSVHSEVGENGQCMIYLKKNPTKHGVNGRSFDAALIETKAIARLAKAAEKTYGVGAITLTHGECDAGNKNYEADLYQLWSDYNTDLSAITGQTQKVLLIVSQQNAVNDRSASTLAQWKAGADHAAEIVCSGPKYQYPYARDGVHLTTDGYQLLGEKYAQVYFQRGVLGQDWRPLEPVAIERAGAVITLHYHVPTPPMAWETNFSLPHQSVEQWKEGKGFEVTSASGTKVPIKSVELSGDSVVVTCANDPGAGTRVSYAMIGERTKMSSPFPGTARWGLLRDSDSLVGFSTQKSQPNYGVAFEWTVP